MKSALILVISPLFLIGVFADELKLVSVKKGDSVTLHTDISEILTDDEIEWRLNGRFIAKISNNSILVPVALDEKFRNRLKLNKQTGDLKIINIETTDSGTYKLKITTTRWSSEKIFNVRGVFNADRDPVKSVPVTVGESVKLKPEKQRDEVVKWKFGSQNTLIAELKVPADGITVYDDVLDGIFRDRLKLDDQTGSLNITNITTEHAGVYEAEIRGSGYTILKTFSVTVRDEVKLVLMEGDSVTLPTDFTQIQTNDVILWRFGDQNDLIARLNGPDVYNTWRNVHLNKQTGGLNITNIRRDQFGDYKVEINTINMISHKKYHIAEIVNLVLVMEGDSVTLHTDATKIPRDDAVLWYWDKNVQITPLPGSVDARWRNTVQNDQTGYLTIRNIRKDQSGDYKVIFKNVQMLFMSIHRKFHINITDVFSDETGGVKTVSVTKGESVFLNTSVTEIQKGDLIEWLFGPQNITIAKTDGKSNSISYNDKDVRFKNRLNLDIQTGGLTIENSNSEHSGRYQLKIINNNTYTIQKSFSVTVNSGLSPAVPYSGLHPDVIAGIVIAVLVVFVAAAGVIYYRRRCSKPERRREVNGQNDTSNKDEETELAKPAEAVEQR